ncbi:MAG: OB-fold-containig protein [Pseudomonadota bacterium]
MVEFILTEANRPFAIAIAAMLILGFLELLLAMGGFGMMGVLDNLVPDDWDLDADIDVDAGVDMDLGADMDMDADVDVGGGAGAFLQMVLGFFGIGRVPLLVVIVAFLTSFGLAGYATQMVVHGVSGYYLPALLASVPAFVVGSFITRYMAIGLGRLVPDIETEAVESKTFIGRTAVLTMGEARTGKPAQAKLRDHNGLTHYLLIEPDQVDMVFREGDQVLLISQQGSIFKAIEVTSDALVRE